MAKDRSEKKEKLEKKEKRSEKDGVHKSKKDKKEKKDKTALADAVLKGIESESPSAPPANGVAPTDDVETRPIGALVPFAKPLLEEKAAKKALKSVKKGKLPIPYILPSTVSYLKKSFGCYESISNPNPTLYLQCAKIPTITAAANKCLKRGVKEVVKALRKSPIPAPNESVSIPNGVVILAADISPMDVISHIPVLCEDHGIPYIFVTSRAELGNAAATKRPTSVTMVVPKSAAKGKKKDADEDDEDFSKVFEELAKLAQKELTQVNL